MIYQLTFSTGSNLTKLDLHHVDNIDLRAILVLNLNCPNLTIFKLSGCSFNDNRQFDELEEDVFERNLSLRSENEILSQLGPFFDLNELCISSACEEKTLIVLLTLCLNIKKLTIGTSCLISDDCFDQVFISNKFQQLTDLEIRKTDLLTMKTVRLEFQRQISQFYFNWMIVNFS